MPFYNLTLMQLKDYTSNLQTGNLYKEILKIVSIWYYFYFVKLLYRF